MLEWLAITRIDTPLKERKTLEMFGYVLRTILQRIVLEAVRIHSPSELRPLDTGFLDLRDYEVATKQVLANITHKAA